MKTIKWSEEEKIELQRICNSGWDHIFPGYSWVASCLNSEFKNNRTAIACKEMDKKLNK